MELDKLTMVNLYLRKDGKTFDMRFKSNRDFIKANEWGWFNKTMQKVANFLGSPIVFGSGHLFWKLYLNPFWHIQQWWWLRKPIKMYGPDKFIHLNKESK